MATWYYGIQQGSPSFSAASQTTDPNSDIEIKFDTVLIKHRISLEKAIENIQLYIGRNPWSLTAGALYFGINHGEPYFNVVSQTTSPGKDVELRIDPSITKSRIGLKKDLMKLKLAIGQNIFPPA